MRCVGFAKKIKLDCEQFAIASKDASFWERLQESLSKRVLLTKIPWQCQRLQIEVTSIHPYYHTFWFYQ